MTKQGYDPSRCHLQKAGPLNHRIPAYAAALREGFKLPQRTKNLQFN